MYKVWTTPLIVLLLVISRVPVAGDDDLVAPSSWEVPSIADIEQEFADWLEELNSYPETRNSVLQRVQSLSTVEIQQAPLESVLIPMSMVHPEIKEFVEQSKRKRTGLETVNFDSVLEDPGVSQFVKDHVRLLYARWLAQNELLEEAKDQFDRVDFAKSLAPATFLFYRGLTQHQLSQKEACIASISRLLENEDDLPRRFVILGRLMLADIEPLEADSLDEISRMMRDIGRRQSLYRSGRRVRQQEKEVIDKLDKLIEKIENQRQMAQSKSSSGAQPSSPMQDSQNAGGQGTGDVRGKPQFDGGDWGSLPPEARAAAMAEMSKDLPPHYRAVIEEYFRRLADDNKD